MVRNLTYKTQAGKKQSSFWLLKEKNREGITEVL